MSIVSASNAFGLDLWSRLPPGNLAVSPASISAALAMTWAGANTETAAEMQRALRLDDASLAAWGKLVASLQDDARSFQLRIANRLFGARTYRFEPTYLDQLRSTLDAPLEPLDFATAPEPSRAHINEWVSDRTEQRIKDLLPPGSLSPTTRLALVNAIYFLADWLTPFNKDNTTTQPFTIAPGQARPVMMMFNRDSYSLARTDHASILALPYADSEATMLVVLPDRPDGLDALERTLDLPKLAAWRRALRHQEVVVWLPRFTIDPPSALELVPSLRALGISLAFDPDRADFTRMANPPPSDRLYLSQAFHKAFVRVDERGTEAAASTVVEMRARGLPPPAPEFKADHPFLFFIIDDATDLVLFMGRVTDPS